MPSTGRVSLASSQNFCMLSLVLAARNAPKASRKRACSAADAAFCHDVANRYTDVLLAAQQADGRPSFLGLYYNYLGVYALRDFGTRYWAENFKRLQRIKSRVDPYNLFSKPLTVHASAT